MTRYLLGRLLITVPVLLFITIGAFVALELAPGDALSARGDPDVLLTMTPEQVATLRERLGLDTNPVERYAIWLRDLTLHGDLGYSLRTGRAVADELKSRLPPTLLLMGVSYTIGTLLGVWLGFIAATRRGGYVDHMVSAFSAAAIAVPSFAIGLLLIYLLGATWHVFPVSGMSTPGEPWSFADAAKHMVLPAITLALPLAGPLARYSRASVLDVLNSDFVVTARSKGLAEHQILRQHVFRNSLTPIVTILGLALPGLLAGAVIVETLFGWPGMGQMAVTAANGRDAPLMMGVILVVGIGVVVSNLLTDIFYGVIDPRVRLGAKA